MTRKLAIVTGGNKGIGLAIVKGLCKDLKEFDVYLTARDEGRGKASVEDLKKQGLSLSPMFHQLDITDTKSIENLKKFVQEKYGGLDVLVNNAGIAYKAASTAPFSEQASVTMTTNFNGTLNTCNALFPLLRPGARVVHVSSFVSKMSLGKCSDAIFKKFCNMTKLEEVAAEMKAFVDSAQNDTHQKKGYANSAYGMSKVGVTVMTPIQQKNVDKEHPGKDIVVNSCCPGYVDTDMTSHKGHLTIEQGADTPIYLATLPANVKSPRGEFLSKRKVEDWRQK